MGTTWSLNKVAARLGITPHHPAVTFASLPPEIRNQIWHHVVEPKLAFLHDITDQPGAYSLPSATQVNKESRAICSPGYDRVGQGPYFQFANDIFICDHQIVDQPSNDFFDALTLRVQRLALWDCLDDDSMMELPSSYEGHLQDCFGRKISEMIEFDKLWFSNLKELWIVKIGDVDPAWGVKRDKNTPRAAQIRQLARQFRYWVKDGIIEMSQLDPTEPSTKFLLDHGRCREDHCRESNNERPMIVSRVLFMDSPYKERVRDNTEWVRIAPRTTEDQENDEDGAAERRRMRWALVERMLMFWLRWDIQSDDDGAHVTRSRTISSD